MTTRVERDNSKNSVARGKRMGLVASGSVAGTAMATLALAGHYFGMPGFARAGLNNSALTNRQEVLLRPVGAFDPSRVPSVFFDDGFLQSEKHFKSEYGAREGVNDAIYAWVSNDPKFTISSFLVADGSGKFDETATLKKLNERLFNQVAQFESQAGLSNADRFTRQNLRFNAIAAAAAVIAHQDQAGTAQDPTRPNGLAGEPYPLERYLKQGGRGVCGDHAQLIEKAINVAGKEDGVMKGVRASIAVVVAVSVSYRGEHGGHAYAIAEYSTDAGKPSGLFTPFDTVPSLKGATKKPDRIGMGPTTKAERLLFNLLNLQQVNDAPFAGRPQDQYFFLRQAGEIYKPIAAASHTGKAYVAWGRWSDENVILRPDGFRVREAAESARDLAALINQ